PSRSSPAARSGGESDPFLSLRREMDRLFDDFTQFWDRPFLGATNGALAPRVDMVETENGLEITAELPGVDPKDIELDLADDVLTLKAEHKSEREEKDDKRRYYLVERSHGTLMRRFELPFEPDQDQLES